MNTPTTGISKFLDQLFRPLFDKHVLSTTIIDGVDLIRRLKTFDIIDLYSVTTRRINQCSY
jgi:predicted transcriptional regulator